MEKYYNFTIDTIHLPSKIDDMYDYTNYAKVLLSDEEVAELIDAIRHWYASEEYKNQNVDSDEEYFLHKYVPHIYAKVRKAIDEQAPSIWGDQIIPYLSQVDIYCPEELEELA